MTPLLSTHFAPQGRKLGYLKIWHCCKWPPYPIGVTTIQKFKISLNTIGFWDTLPPPTHAGEIHPVRDLSDTFLNVFSYKQDRFHAVLRLISHETLSLRKINRIKFVTFHRKLRWVRGRPTSNVKSSVVTKWSTNFEHSESLMKMDFRTSVVHALYQFCASRKFTNRCREQTKRRGAPMHRSTRISQVLASVHFVSLCSSRREKSALKFTLIESLFMRLQREMLSNFLSLSDFS